MRERGGCLAEEGGVLVGFGGKVGWIVTRRSPARDLPVVPKRVGSYFHDKYIQLLDVLFSL